MESLRRSESVLIPTFRSWWARGDRIANVSLRGPIMGIGSGVGVSLTSLRPLRVGGSSISWMRNPVHLSRSHPVRSKYIHLEH